MDKEEFKQRLEQLAVIKDNKPLAKPKMIKEVHVDEDGEEYTIEVPEEQYNPTVPFKLVKIKPQSKLCVLDCGKIVENQVIERRMALTPQKHWRTRCQNCGMYVSPTGDTLVQNGRTVAEEFIKYYNQKKRGETVTSEQARIDYQEWLKERKNQKDL